MFKQHVCINDRSYAYKVNATLKLQALLKQNICLYKSGVI